MSNLIQAIKVIINVFKEEAITVGRQEVLKNIDSNIDMAYVQERLKKTEDRLNAAIIMTYDPITFNTQYSSFNYESISPHNLVSNNIISYCKKWEVDIDVLKHEDFLYLQRYDKFYVNPNNRTIGIIPSANKILLSEKATSKNPLDSIVLHELAHICMRVRPDIINEIRSPINNLFIKFLLKCNVHNGILNDQNLVNAYKKYDADLIKLGLFDENNNETFDSSNVVPELAWLNVLG